MAVGGLISLNDPKLQELSYVEDDGKFYKVTIQIGASRQWRHYTGGKWIRDTQREVAEGMDGKKAFRHVAKIHVTEPVQSGTLNGLISEHNEWLRANKGNDRIKGDVGKMLLVTRWNEVDPPKLKSNLPVGFEEMMESVVAKATAAAVQASIGALASSGLLGGKAAKAASGEKGSAGANGAGGDLLGGEAR